LQFGDRQTDRLTNRWLHEAALAVTSGSLITQIIRCS